MVNSVENMIGPENILRWIILTISFPRTTVNGTTCTSTASASISREQNAVSGFDPATLKQVAPSLYNAVLVVTRIIYNKFARALY